MTENELYEAFLPDQANRPKITKGIELIFALILGLSIGYLIGSPALGESDKATIGDHTVENLSCEEDEVIGFVPLGNPPYDLKCYYWENGTMYYNGEEVPQ